MLRGALEGAAHVALHRQQGLIHARRPSDRRASARATFGVADEGQVRGVVEFHEPRERQRASEPAPRARRREHVARAVDHGRGAVDRRDLVAQVGVVQQVEPARRATRATACRARRAAQRARASASRACGAAERIEVHEMRESSFAGPLRRPSAKACQRPARHRMRPAVALRRSTGVRAHEAQHPDARRVPRGEPHRDQPAQRPAAHERRLRARMRGHGVDDGIESREGDARANGRGPAGRRGEGGTRPRAAARAHARRRRAVPTRAAARGPGRCPSRSTCSAIAQDFAQGRGQRQTCSREWAAESDTRSLAVPVGHRRRADRGHELPEFAQARGKRHGARGVADDHGLDRRRGGGLDAVARAGAAELADVARAAWPRAPGVRSIRRRASVATAAAAGGSAVENT